ncbi:MAG: hypothetical protein WCS96_14425 [Victivallales bacterium]
MSAFFGAIHTAFSEAGIKPILVGGWAVNHLGHTRNTMDLDLMIRETDAEKLHMCLERAGFHLLFRNPDLFAKYGHSREKIFELDILFADKTTYEKLKSDSSEIRVGKMKNHCMKEKTADYLSRFPRTALSSSDYEKFIRTCFSVSPPPKRTLEESLRHAPKSRFKLN